MDIKRLAKEKFALLEDTEITPAVDALTEKCYDYLTAMSAYGEAEIDTDGAKDIFEELDKEVVTQDTRTKVLYAVDSLIRLSKICGYNDIIQFIEDNSGRHLKGEVEIFLRAYDAVKPEHYEIFHEALGAIQPLNICPRLLEIYAASCVMDIKPDSDLLANVRNKYLYLRMDDLSGEVQKIADAIIESPTFANDLALIALCIMVSEKDNNPKLDVAKYERDKELMLEFLNDEEAGAVFQ